jgi:hypothetical protein
MKVRSEQEFVKYVRVHRSFLRIMGLAMLTYFAFDLTDALTDFVSVIPTKIYTSLLVIPLSFYLVTGIYCLILSRWKTSSSDR